MYITQLDIKNFKSYLDDNIKFKKITLLTGLNGAGKSTVFQSLRMFKQILTSRNMILNQYGELKTLKNINTKEPLANSISTKESK